MIFVNSVMNSILNIISSDQTVVDCGVNVEMNQLYNIDPNQMPWVGIYNAPISIVPHRANIVNPWLVTYAPIIYIQDELLNFNGQSTTENLDELLTIVLTSINSNRTLDQTVDLIRGFEIVPFELDIQVDEPVFAYEVTLNAEVRR